MARIDARFNDQPRPRLTIVLPTIRPWPEIADALAASIHPSFDEPYEILVMDGHGEGLDREPHPPVRWVRRPGADVFDLRAAAVVAARGEIVLFGEDHCLAHADWYESVSAAHRSTAAPVLIGPVSNHPASSQRAIDRAAFALTLGAFAPPLSAVPEWRLPVPTNLSVKREWLPEAEPASGWLEYDMLAVAMARGAIGVAEAAPIHHRQAWSALGALAVHFQSGRSYGASLSSLSARDRGTWWRHVPSAPAMLYRRTVPVIDAHLAGARSVRADRWWLAALVLANVTGQVTGALAGPGASRRSLL